MTDLAIETRRADDTSTAAAMYAKECATLRARVAELEAYAESLDAQLIAVSIATDARVERLRAALKRHGAHGPVCALATARLTGIVPAPCTCGLSRAMEEST